MNDRNLKPETVMIYDRKVPLDELLADYKKLKAHTGKQKKAVRKYAQEEELKPYQAELIKMQQHLEASRRRMIILFEGRDAAGKGGTIRRVTRYMNEKHYRVVALGKPTEEQKTQWFFQKYVAQCPRGGRGTLSLRQAFARATSETP